MRKGYIDLRVDCEKVSVDRYDAYVLKAELEGCKTSDILGEIDDDVILKYVIDGLGWQEVLSYAEVSQEELEEYIEDSY